MTHVYNSDTAEKFLNLNDNLTLRQTLRRYGALVPIVLNRRTEFYGTPIPGMVAETRVQSIKGVALLDTGASSTCIDVGLSGELGLKRLNMTKMSTPSDVGVRRDVYSGVEIHLLGSDFFLKAERVIETHLKAQGYQMLIGRDVLEEITFVYKGRDGSFSLET